MVLPPQNNPQGSRQTPGTGTSQGTAPARQCLRVLRHTCLFVFLSLGNREDGKNVNVILSPLSHRSARAEVAPVLPERGLRHPKTSSKPAQNQLSLPARPCSDTFPIPADGDIGVPGDNFPSLGKARQGFAFPYLHFLIAPAGFLGQRPAPVSMAGFVRTWRTEGRHKEATMELPLTRIKGGSDGAEQPKPPGSPSTGGPPGQGNRGRRSLVAGDALRTFASLAEGAE